MKQQNKAWYMAIGGILALALVFGAVATFAQSDGTEPSPDTPELPPGEGTGEPPLAPPWGLPDRDDFGHGPRTGDENIGYLAAALNISVEELQAAYQAAHLSFIEQAVTDGRLTREQADQLLSGELRFGRQLGDAFAGAPAGVTFLAEALGISEEALQTAMTEARSTRLTELVESGVMTQEQADLMIARQAVAGYFDRESLQEAMQSAYESAVQQALADGAITQAQADQLRENPLAFSPRGFHGGHGGHGHGGFRGGPGGGFPSRRGVGPSPGVNAPSGTSAQSDA